MPYQYGFGTSFGLNYGAGSPILIEEISPEPSGVIPPDGFFRFVVGTASGLISISKTFITVNDDMAFSGDTSSFINLFAQSSHYSHRPDKNGYIFYVNRSGGFSNSSVTVKIYSETSEGNSTEQSYELIAIPNIVYPPVRYGVPLVNIPLTEFSGQSSDVRLNGNNGGTVFFTPSLESKQHSSINVNFVEVKAEPSDTYKVQQQNNTRPMLLYPVKTNVNVFPPQMGSPYEPVLNSANFGTLKTKHEVIGIEFNTITMKETKILY